MAKIIQRLETGRFSLQRNISSGIWDHQSKNLQAGTYLWSTAWPGRNTTTHRCFKSCLVYKLFHPSVAREVNSIYMRQSAIITRLTENNPSPCQPILQRPAPSQMWKANPDTASTGLGACLGFTSSRWSQLLTPPWHRLCAALTSVNMSYCLPTWQGRFPVFIHCLVSPNQCQ